jgi:hypothetical protein
MNGRTGSIALLVVGQAEGATLAARSAAPTFDLDQRADRNRITRRVPALNPCEAQANAVARNAARMPPIKRYFTV